MFCQNCGTKNADGAMFCENCGTKLEAVVTTGSVAPVEEKKEPVASVKKSFKINVLMIVAILELVLVIVAGVFLVNSIKKANSVEKTITSFWNHMASGNYSKAYEYLNADDYSTLTESAFVSAMQSQPYAEAGKVRVKRVREDKDEASCEIEFEYDDQEYVLELELEADGKKGLFGKNWKISVAPFVVRNVRVYVPSGSQLFIDDQEISDKYLEEDLDYYEIPRMFKGYHSFYAQSGVLETRKYVESIEYTEQFIYIEELILSNEAAEDLYAKAEEVMNALAKNLVEGGSYEDVAGYFTEHRENDTYYNTNEMYYDEASDGFFNTATEGWGTIDGTTSLALSDTVISYEYITSDAFVQLEISTIVDVAYGEYDIDRKSMTTNNYQHSSVMYVEFAYIDGEWVAVDVYDFYSILEPGYYND